ncbi:MAG: homoaconitate hydratase, partial [Ignisphaera sp.]
ASAIKFLLGYEVGVKFNKIRKVVEKVSEYFGIAVPVNKPIVGRNAFAHESGIHVHGVLSHPLTYEPIDPSIVGAERLIVLGKHSGRHAVEYILKQMGIEPKEEVVTKVLKIVKDLGDKGIKIDRSTIENIISDVVKEVNINI